LGRSYVGRLGLMYLLSATVKYLIAVRPVWVFCMFILLYRVIKSLRARDGLYCNRQVYRDFLITLYFCKGQSVHLITPTFPSLFLRSARIIMGNT